MSWHDIVMMLAPTLAVIASAILGQMKRKEYYHNLHITMNSRLDELLRTARLQSFAEGRIKGALDVRKTDSFDTID